MPILTTTEKTSYDIHRINKDNPHDVTKDQIGLSNVDDTADSDKPISDATQTALDLKQDILAEGEFEDGDKTKLDNLEIGSTVQPYNADTVIDANYTHTDNNFTDAYKDFIDELNATGRLVKDVNFDSGTGLLQVDYTDDTSSSLSIRQEFTTFVEQVYVGTFGETVFTFDTTNATALLVSYNGRILNPLEDWTKTATTVTLSEPVSYSGDIIMIQCWKTTTVAPA